MVGMCMCLENVVQLEVMLVKKLHHLRYALMRDRTAGWIVIHHRIEHDRVERARIIYDVGESAGSFIEETLDFHGCTPGRSSLVRRPGTKAASFISKLVRPLTPHRYVARARAKEVPSSAPRQQSRA